MSLFSKKHYSLIARAIYESRESDDSNIIHAYWLVRMLSFAFKQDNPRFDADTFRVACGEKPEHFD